MEGLVLRIHISLKIIFAIVFVSLLSLLLCQVRADLSPAQQADADAALFKPLLDQDNTRPEAASFTTMQVALDNGANVNAKDSNGDTPLMLAANGAIPLQFASINQMLWI
jgi:ankyrin repeat protein